MSEVTKTHRKSIAKTDWHLICITNKGVVSILKNMDLFTARETYKKLLPRTHPVRWERQPCLESGRHVVSHGGAYWSSCTISGSSLQDSIASVEAVGPEGEELDAWSGVEPTIRVDPCRCGCLGRQQAREYREMENLATESIEERRLRELHKQVPTAFWLDHNAHA